MGGEHLQCCYREQLAYSLYARFREPKLFRMAVDGNWDTIPERCLSHPREAAFLHKYAPYDTALHRVLRPTESECSFREDLDDDMKIEIDGIKFAAVRALLLANPEAASIQDAFGRTPLHLACIDSEACCVASASLIVKSNPQACLILDVEKRTPLHFLLARNDTISPEFLELLVAHGANAVYLKDAVGESAIDIVRRRHDKIKNSKHVLDILKRVATS
ncbi:predicted protein [Phaeodactylum tricornutum CCAP 1055/1]|jgi:hypothetical protein|uniref:Ankyrin repeat protein n=2 Tax=Phaeodactylum tricornutum TaxID=2850 RepID=B5Y4Y3_PHATC|nr:predicted protein [Phaeodactylum tricornutum CCAP 1055/1]ACI65557.1 predicted protein [Phaeodactylum tricornutum CCAP 1055/1]|eukprot:XP_002186087.1 predicted protein [Phaeodactylum tricornutum CCAP 1055/1]